MPGTVPGAPLFTKDAVKRIAAYAESLGFEIVPLIQVHGHLEWILKHDAYSFCAKTEP